MKSPASRVERTKERIIRAALELFLAQGFKKVAITEVAYKAGVTPATVYNRFTDKDTLVLETVKYWYGEALRDYTDVLTHGRSFEEKLRNLISFKTDAAAQMHGEFSAFIASDNPGIRQYIESVYADEVIPVIDRFFEEGRKQGYVNPDITTGMIMRYTDIIRRGLSADAEAQSNPEYTKKMVEELTPFVLYGILGKPHKDKAME